jgi:hypothetical protein
MVVFSVVFAAKIIVHIKCGGQKMILKCGEQF